MTRAVSLFSAMLRGRGEHRELRSGLHGAAGGTGTARALHAHGDEVPATPVLTRGGGDADLPEALAAGDTCVGARRREHLVGLADRFASAVRGDRWRGFRRGSGHLGGSFLRVRREEVPLRGVLGGPALGLRSGDLSLQASELEGEGLELLNEQLHPLLARGELLVEHRVLLAQELVLGGEGGDVHAHPYPSTNRKTSGSCVIL